MKVDGVVNSSGTRVSMILTSPNKQYTQIRAVRLRPNLLNNQAEYEALLFGMEWAHRANITALQIYNDSQLVVNQVQGTYAVHSEGL